MNELFEILKSIQHKNPLIIYGVVLLIVVVGSYIWSSDEHSLEKSKQQGTQLRIDDEGVKVGDTERLEVMKGLQKNYYDFEDRIKEMEEQIKGIKQADEQYKKEQLNISGTLSTIKEDLGKVSISSDISKESSYELKIAPVRGVINKKYDVYLPIGSFCKGTLLTGVYASVDVNSPLPVLITLDEAFYGPNNARIPLKGAFALGKAIGDINSQRALIQIIAISYVQPDGKVFEKEQEIGYVTDRHGELGIHGQLVHSTGKALALAFMGGFMAGGSSALADSEQTSVSGRFGNVERNVTGDAGKYAMFSGLSKSAAELSQYYDKQTQNIIPAVHVPSGTSINFVVQKGVMIDGLLRRDVNHIDALN